MANVIYNVSNVAMRTVLRAFSNWKVEGLEHVIPMGPLLVVANHLSYVDPPLLGATLPRRLRFVAKSEVFKSLTGWFLRAYGAHPLNRDGRDIEGFHWVRKMLNQDEAIVLFPEAHRNPETGMRRVAPGVALLALHTQAPILPVGISGTEHLGPLWRVIFPTGDIRVNIGPPFALPQIQGNMRREQLQSLADSIMHRVSALVPERYQGVYRLEAGQRSGGPRADGK